MGTYAGPKKRSLGKEEARGSSAKFRENERRTEGVLHLGSKGACKKKPTR